MEQSTVHLISQLSSGFDALQAAYRILFSHTKGLERKLATAREQVRTASLYDEYTIALDLQYSIEDKAYTISESKTDAYSTTN
ncbi:hypothetical protein K470DRAFT_79176 [Piedraia hortae CBS 480.64]|uniref:Uncharacterized protein n=1 Tax=Piedraia hortae CBS 480.64 TaxID=1314780 RepID=A0A6A7BXW1_9PEZI|nr:hypothetical protein K470DRAFT_79176 [Piedraia hortae CBS 480.64]